MSARPPSGSRSLRAGVFLDRDGTIISDPGYLRDPALVVMLQGAGPAIARLNQAGLPVIVVTNQSGISRGLLTEAEYLSVAARLDQLLLPFGARIDASYHCPHAPERNGPCECRKPGLLLFERAARDHAIDLTSSWWVGDRLTDIRPAETVGGTGLLVETGQGPEHRSAAVALGFEVVAGLEQAVERILR
ncbi:MAG TPA: HAD family hydrolase [Gemmatimonadales bacterium]|nr:HAD family hydrolase [Gemmatimonadales bacterium]